MVYNITDFLGNQLKLQPRVELYQVKDFMGQTMPGLAIVLDEIGEEPEDISQYGVLTVSFGEFIGQKNTAYIDTNNCSFARQFLDQGVARETGFYKESGFCRYPLWEFNPEFLQEHSHGNYEKYENAFDAYMSAAFPEDDEEADMTMEMA